MGCAMHSIRSWQPSSFLARLHSLLFRAARQRARHADAMLGATRPLRAGKERTYSVVNPADSGRHVGKAQPRTAATGRRGLHAKARAECDRTLGGVTRGWL